MSEKSRDSVPAVALAPRTGKIIKKCLAVFERGENLL